jgi:biopolymer transport protein TolR
LAVNASGQVFFNDKPLTLDALALQLAQAAQQNPTAEVQLRADEAVPYGRIVQVMGLAQKVGLNRIGFVTDARPPAKP